MRIALENFHIVDAVVMTQDPLVIENLTERLAASRKRISQLRHDLANAAVTDTALTASRIAGRGGTPPRSAALKEISNVGNNNSLAATQTIKRRKK